MFEPWQLRQSAAEILSVSGSPVQSTTGGSLGPLRVSLGCFGVKVQVFEVMRVFCHRFYYLLPFLSRPEWCFSPIFPKSCFCWTRMSQMRRRKKMRRDELKPVSLDPTEPQPQPNPNLTPTQPSFTLPRRPTKQRPGRLTQARASAMLRLEGGLRLVTDVQAAMFF